MPVPTSTLPARDAVARLSAAWHELGRGPALVVTGAGISLASGISTFRGSDPDAIWKASDVELATVDYFHRDPVGQWRWYLERFLRLDGAAPNPAHEALADLERLHVEAGGEMTVVTQNIDLLHERAGSRRLIKIHGSSDRVRCSRTGCTHGAPRGSLPRDEARLETFTEAPSIETLPRCPDCRAPLRAHVLFFDEYYQDHADYRFAKAMAAAERAELVLFAGTSFSVGITDLIGRAARHRRVPVYSIDPNPAPRAHAYGVRTLAAPAEELLPAVVAGLRDSAAAPGRDATGDKP